MILKLPLVSRKEGGRRTMNVKLPLVSRSNIDLMYDNSTEKTATDINQAMVIVTIFMVIM